MIDDLWRKKFLFDERLTEANIRSQCIFDSDPVEIKAELNNKNISNKLMLDYLDPGGAIKFDNAKLEYQKKHIETSIDDYKAWKKRARFLQNRGFTMEQIQCAIVPLEEN